MTTGAGAACAEPGLPSNGKKHGEDYSIGATVTYECDDGYKLIGSSSRTCLDDSRWSTALPTCEPGKLGTGDTSALITVVSNTLSTSDYRGCPFTRDRALKGIPYQFL